MTWDIAGSHDVTCDVTEPEQIEAAVGVTQRRWGIPTWVTVTAGIGHAGLLTDAEPDEFDRVMRVNARGPWLCMRAWVDPMRAQGVPGSFVAVSSISARVVDRNMGLYCASKAALSMLVKVAAAEWGELALRVNAVAPGVTRTPMLGTRPVGHRDGSPWLANVAGRTALGRLGEAFDIAEVILGVHAMEWLTGQVIECDGGLSLHSPIDAYGEMVRARAKPAAGAGRGRRYEAGRDAPGGRRTKPVAHDVEQVVRRRGLVRGGLAGRAHERHYGGGRDVLSYSAHILGAAQEHLDGGAEPFLDVGGCELERHARTHDRHQEIALRRALLHDMGKETEEGRRRVLRVGQRLGIESQRRQPLEEDGLAELLLGREVAVERPDAHAGLLGDDVDGRLDPLGREDDLGRLEDAGAVPLRVGAQRTFRYAARAPASSLPPLPSMSGPQKSPSPG